MSATKVVAKNTPSKTKPILIGVGVVILILIAVYFFIGRSEDTISMAPAPVVTEAEKVEEVATTPEVVQVVTLAPPVAVPAPPVAVPAPPVAVPAPPVAVAVPTPARPVAVAVPTTAPPVAVAVPTPARPVAVAVPAPPVAVPAPPVAVPVPASVPATNAVAMAGWKIEDNIDYPDGTNLFHYYATSTPKASEAVCLDKCKTTPNCKLVTFNKSKTLCWGKSDIKTKVPNTDRINYFKV